MPEILIFFGVWWSVANWVSVVVVVSDGEMLDLVCVTANVRLTGGMDKSWSLWNWKVTEIDKLYIL